MALSASVSKGRQTRAFMALLVSRAAKVQIQFFLVPLDFWLTRVTVVEKLKGKMGRREK